MHLYSTFIIFIIIIIIIVSFTQDIYTYIPETNYVLREYSVAAILLLLFMVLISLVSVLNLLYFYISTFRNMCAVPNVAVFWSSLTSCFPGMLLIIIIIIIPCMFRLFLGYHHVQHNSVSNNLVVCFSLMMAQKGPKHGINNNNTNKCKMSTKAFCWT